MKSILSSLVNAYCQKLQLDKIDCYYDLVNLVDKNLKLNLITSSLSLASYTILILTNFTYLFKYIIKLKNKSFHLVMFSQLQLIAFGYLAIDAFNISIFKRLKD